jgi:hypothetical protein
MYDTYVIMVQPILGLIHRLCSTPYFVCISAVVRYAVVAKHVKHAPSD